MDSQRWVCRTPVFQFIGISSEYEPEADWYIYNYYVTAFGESVLLAGLRLHVADVGHEPRPAQRILASRSMSLRGKQYSIQK